MLTDQELDDALWDFVADGTASARKWTEIVEQAKTANQYREAMRTIAASGNPKDRTVAAKALEATNDGCGTETTRRGK